MSTRWYPIYQKGNPQLRVFLPNFWMKMVKQNDINVPKNRLQFIVSNGMSRFDVKNYLEKIYNVPVVNVKIQIKQGQTKRAPGKQYIVKEDDYKVAFVTLPREMKFEFPDMFPVEKRDKDLQDEQKQLEQMQQQKDSFLEKRKHSFNLPGWFT